MNSPDSKTTCYPLEYDHDGKFTPEGTYDVVVIGAGPSGLMLSQALGGLGIHVRVIERRVPGSQYGNADGLQPRTLEIWESYGLLDKMRPKSACMCAMVAYEASPDGMNLIRQRPSSNIIVPCRYQYEMTASITDIEGTLRERAEQSSVEITQPCWPTSLEVADETRPGNPSFPVKMTVEYPNGRDIEVINAKYVVGADGASSWVRRSLGIEMQGEQTEDVWGVVDAFVDTDMPDCRFKCAIRATSGAIIIIPREGDKIRIYVQLSASDRIPRDSDGKLDKTSLPENEIIAILLSRIRAGFSPFKINFTQVIWSTIFSTAQRVASTFSHNGRVFIVGDACHTHSPNAGQGANASMGDSHNLAWKLAYVLRGWTDPSILRTYEIERREYALNLISFDRKISQSLEGMPAAEYKRSLHTQNMFSSGIGISYAKSPLTVQPQEPVGFMVPGERVFPSPITRLGDWAEVDIHDLLISDGLFKLLIFPGDLLLPQTQSNLTSFANTIHESRASSGANVLANRFEIYTILRSNKEDVIWTAIPSSIVSSWRNCFIIRSNEEDIYEKFQISGISEGVTILVRPDGYISIASKMTCEGANKIIDFMGLSSA